MSLFARSPTDAPAWQRAAFQLSPLTAEAHIVHAPGRAPVIVPAFATDFALACTKFQPLTEHLAAYAEKHYWDRAQARTLHEMLPGLIDAGLFVSDTMLRERLGGMKTAPPPPLQVLGVPTGGTRFPLVERALRSFAANAAQHGRAIEFLVADSSSDPTHAEAWRSNLSTVGLPVSLAGEREKRAFIAHLVQRGACAPEVAEFALLDPLGTGFALGGNRNALLLHQAGSLLASIDDDVVCQLASAPEPDEHGHGFFSHTDPYRRWLHTSRDETLASVRAIDGDYLGLHESLLGRAPGDLAGAADFALADEGVTQRLLDQSCRVRATFTGHYGDPGIPTSAYFLYYTDDNRARLVASEPRYRQLLASRQIGCFPARPMLGDATLSPGVSFALDLRTLLPPFFPVLHAEDFSWSAALWQTCPEALLGHLPRAVWHDPPPGKTLLPPRAFAPGHRGAFFEFAHLLRRLLFAERMPMKLGVEGRLQRLGHKLRDLGALSPSDFREQLVEHALHEISGRVQYLTEQLDESPEAPAFWREDVEHLIEQLTAAIGDDTVDIPLDLLTPNPRADMQRMLGLYGELLLAWPAIFEATLALRANGITLLQPLRP